MLSIERRDTRKRAPSQCWEIGCWYSPLQNDSDMELHNAANYAEHYVCF